MNAQTGYSVTVCMYPYMLQGLSAVLCAIRCSARTQRTLLLSDNALFLRLGSAKGCQGFRETKICTGGRVLVAVLNLCERIKMRLATFGTKHSVSGSTLTVSRCFNPETS